MLLGQRAGRSFGARRSRGAGGVLREPHVKPMEMRGRIMTGFVRVDPDGYRSEPALKKWVERGVGFVLTLPEAATRGASRRGARRQAGKAGKT